MTAQRVRKPIPCVTPSTNFAVASRSASHTINSAAKIADSTWVKTRTKAESDTVRIEVRPAAPGGVAGAMPATAETARACGAGSLSSPPDGENARSLSDWSQGRAPAPPGACERVDRGGTRAAAGPADTAGAPPTRAGGPVRLWDRGARLADRCREVV